MARSITLPIVVSSTLWLAACRQSVPPGVAATVNGRPITYQELDKYYQRLVVEDASPRKIPGEEAGGSSKNDAGAAKAGQEQELIQKLEVLRSLIDNEIMLQRAEKQGLMAGAADVDARFNELKAPYTQEEFEKWLASRNMAAEDLKTQIRRDLSVRKLFNKEITSHINITEKEVRDSYEANKASFNLAEPQIHLAQILVTPIPDGNVRNLKNDKAQNEEQARRKIEMIRVRLQNGEDFAMLAQNYSEDPVSTPNGGDLGFIGESAFNQANPELRKAILALQPGQLSPILRTPEGYRILKVFLGTGRTAGSRRSQGPADHPRDPPEPQGPASESRLLRGGPQRGRGRELPGDTHHRDQRQAGLILRLCGDASGDLAYSWHESCLTG